MANNNTAQILAGAPKVTGGIYRAPLGTALPTDASTALPAAYKLMGFVSEKGVEWKDDRKLEKIKEWGGRIVRILQSEFSTALSWEFLETNADVLKAAYGDTSVTTTAPTASKGTLISLAVKGDLIVPAIYVFEMTDINAPHHRVVVPNSQLSVDGSKNFSASDVIMYGANLDALPDGSGTSVFEYIEMNDKTA